MNGGSTLYQFSAGCQYSSQRLDAVRAELDELAARHGLRLTTVTYSTPANGFEQVSAEFIVVPTEGPQDAP